MRRLFLGATALAIAASGTIGVGAARADASALSDSMAVVSSSTNKLLSKIPGLDGPDKRHICIIDDPLDFYYCIYIPLP